MKIAKDLLQCNPIEESNDKKYVYLIENGIEKNVGVTTEIIKFLTLNGQHVIHREQALTSDVLGDRKGIILIEGNSLKPISYTSYLEGEEANYDYQDGYVQMINGTQEKHIKLKEKNAYDSFSVEMILRILPLEMGYITSFTAFNPSIESEIEVKIEVVGKEPINKGKDLFSDSWKVKAFFGDVLQYYWISADSKELLKQSSQIGEGIILEFRR